VRPTNVRAGRKATKASVNSAVASQRSLWFRRNISRTLAGRGGSGFCAASWGALAGVGLGGRTVWRLMRAPRGGACRSRWRDRNGPIGSGLEIRRLPDRDRRRQAAEMTGADQGWRSRAGESTSIAWQPPGHPWG